MKDATGGMVDTMTRLENALTPVLESLDLKR